MNNTIASLNDEALIIGFKSLDSLISSGLHQESMIVQCVEYAHEISKRGISLKCINVVSS